MAAPANVTVGIDVAKAQLDVAVQPTGTTWTVFLAERESCTPHARQAALSPGNLCGPERSS